MNNERIGTDRVDFKQYIYDLWKGSTPLVKLFRTNSSGYLYDTGTNKIIRCHETIFKLLKEILSKDIDHTIIDYIARHGRKSYISATNSIKDAIEVENILKTLEIKDLGLGNLQEYEDLINNSLEILFLEITENCNLRCKYCVYNENVKVKRNHGIKNMSFPVAQKAIEYLRKHSHNNSKVLISFYGGEPLLNFNLLMSCVNYAKSVLKKQKVSFSLTTNGTLITPVIAKFLMKEEFSVFLSIDGPANIHNAYRQDAFGTGSFDRAIKGLRMIIESYGPRTVDKINMNIVYSPPFSATKLDEIASIWEKYSWIPAEIGISITYPIPGTIPKDLLPSNPNHEDLDLIDWSWKTFTAKKLKKFKSNPIATAIMEKEMGLLMQRPIYNKPIRSYSLNGCCIPGVRRLYVSTEGIYRVCERIPSDAPNIGNVQSGIDLELIKRTFIIDFKKKSLQDCSKCWAARLCSVCYTGVFNKGEFDLERKRRDCFILKNTKERILKLYCEFLENDPNGLDYLTNYQLR